MNTVETQPLYGWSTLNWKKIERRVFKLQTRIYRAQGMHDKHQTIEEPCEGKLSRTVLQPSQGGDTLA
jgi:hypothetical protein